MTDILHLGYEHGYSVQEEAMLWEKLVTLAQSLNDPTVNQSKTAIDEAKEILDRLKKAVRRRQQIEKTIMNASEPQSVQNRTQSAN